MKKKLIASITSFALCFTTVCYGLAAPVSAAETNGEGLPDVTDVTYEFYRDPENGHIGMAEPATYGLRSGGESSDEVVPNSYVPSSFSGISSMYSSYPPTRNQNPYGTCWAHAATAAAEFDLVTNHGYSKTTDLSELQLAWFAYHTGNELPGLDGDLTSIPSGAKHYLEVGGNINYSVHTLSQWKGYTTEGKVAYSNVATNTNKNYDVKKLIDNLYGSYHPSAQFRGIRFLNIRTEPSAVKQAIMEYGAVYISYYADSSYYNSSTNTYCNKTNVSTSTSTNTNHDIVIVGWDDTKNAWLARNSWSVSSSGSGSQYTYFWLSYSDLSVAYTAFALDFEPGSTSDNLYQYDGVATHSTLSGSAAANIFTANSNGSYVEKLDSVMVSFTSSANVNYRVEVYTNPTSSNPASGTLHSYATTTGTTGARGIYTIDLVKPVYLSPGERFAVVVKSVNSSGSLTNAQFEIERSRNVTYKQNGTTYSWFDTTAHADAGESFIYNGSWSDATLYGNGYGNIRIKAITSDTSLKKYSISYQMNGGVNNSANPTSFLSSAGGSFALAAPSRSGYHFLGWYSDSGLTTKVTSGSYDNKANQTYYAKWCANSNPVEIKVSGVATTAYDGSYSSICKGCGLNKGTQTSYQIASVELNKSNVAPGGELPVPVVKDRMGNTLVAGTDYTYSYSSTNISAAGKYYVTVEFIGKYGGSSVTKEFTVAIPAPSSVSAKLYGYDDVKVSWSKSSKASGYYIYYKKASASKYSKPKRTTRTYYKFKNLSDGVKYEFKIVPYSGKKRTKSTQFALVYATTLKKMATPKLSKLNSSRVSLSWKNISGASGYQVYWAAKKKGKYKKLCDYSDQYIGVSFSVGKGKTYYYKVRAYKKVGKKKIYAPFSSPKAYKLR